jgi:release factor glutamine methyltransferase
LLIEHGIDEPYNTSLLLLSTAVDQPKTWILAHSDVQPTPEEIALIESLSNRVARGEPLPYVLEEWQFFGRAFKVTPQVLIPRPETETLVAMALDHARKIPKPTIIDVGTGSGAIAVSLAAELPAAKIFASDISGPALQIARENARRYRQTGIHFLQADLLSPIHAQFDLICANLPYIPTNELRNLPVAKWEPCLALDGGISGLDAISALLNQSGTSLSPKGIILLEIESSLGQESITHAEAAFPEASVRLFQDLAGCDRIIEIRNA